MARASGTSDLGRGGGGGARLPYPDPYVARDRERHSGVTAVAVALWLLWSAQADLGDAWHRHIPFQVAMCKVIWFTS